MTSSRRARATVSSGARAPDRRTPPRRRPGVRQQLDQRTRQLRALGEIGAALASAWELQTTLDVITRITSQVMGVASCSIYLQQPGSGRIVLEATTGLAKAAVGRAMLGAGEGLTGWAMTHGQPVAARDAPADPRFKLLPETREESLRSLLAVPLSVQGRTIGAMNVQTGDRHDFSEEDAELLSLIASLAGGAIEKAALYDRMREQIRELEALVAVSRTVTSPLYLDEMLGVVAEMAARLMGARAVALHLVDEATGALVLRASHPAGGANPATAWFSSLGEEAVAEAARCSCPVRVAGLGAEAVPPSGGPGASPPRSQPVAGEGPAGASLLAVPLVVRGRTVGVATCYVDGPHEFTAMEIDLFSMLAGQTALAIENARLVISLAVVREMHHRVKNNLQTVAMLLRLQLGNDTDERTRGILGDAIARVLSIAAVHETLSEQGLRWVAVAQVLQRVARSVAEMVPPGRGIEVEVEADELALPSQAATSLALAACELMQNAVKHAFPGGAHGHVRVRLRTGPTEHELSVVDDGVGEASEASGVGGASESSREAGPRQRKGLGLEIVETLVAHDLTGRLELTAATGGTGTRAVIRFPAAAAGQETGAAP